MNDERELDFRAVEAGRCVVIVRCLSCIVAAHSDGSDGAAPAKCMDAQNDVEVGAGSSVLGMFVAW